MSSPGWKAANAVRATWYGNNPDDVADAALRAVHHEEVLGERDRLIAERDEWKRKAEAWHAEAWQRMNEAQRARRWRRG